MSTTTTASTQIFGADTGFLIACLVVGLIIMISLFVWGIVARPSEEKKINETLKLKEEKTAEETPKKHKKSNKYRNDKYHRIKAGYY